MDLANLDKMKVVDLRNELQSRGLDTKGVKAVLIERLRASLEGGSGGVPPSPGTPSRRSRRTRSMTKSPSPSPVKKIPETILESVEEESSAPNAPIEEKLSTPDKLIKPKTQESPSSDENLENKNNSPSEELQASEENSEKEYQEDQTNGGENTVSTGDIDEAMKHVSENRESAECLDKVVDEKISTTESTDENVETVKDHQDNQDGSPQLSKSIRDSSLSHSANRHERSNRSHSDSRSKSPLSRHKSRSRSRSRSRSPHRRTGAGEIGSPPKEGEDTSTPEDEPTIEENQFGLSWFDSDLHLRIDPVTFTSAKPMSHDIYALVWSGARSNYGVREGKVCFEVRLSEETNLNRDHPFRDEPHTKGFRVGFSMPTTNLLLGESENSFAYCESGCKATNGDFVEFAKPFQLDDVVGCYLNLENSPCTIKYTLNGKDLGVAFEFDKAILGENIALFPHILTKGYEYEINFADNDNLLVNVERKIRKRRKVKKIAEKEESEEQPDENKIDKTTENEKTIEGNREEKTNEGENDEQLQTDSKKQEQNNEVISAEEEVNLNKEGEGHTTICENPKEDPENNISEEGDSKTIENKEKNEKLSATKVGEKETSKDKNSEDKSTKNKDDCGPSPSKRQKIETIEEDEYEEIHPEPRDNMSLLEEYELIALIPEEQYIAGPQRPESRKDCEVILMVGLPGAGKSTWVANHIKENADKRYHVIGADALIAKMTINGTPRKSVHKGRFDRIYELCFNVLTSLEDIAVKRRRNFILDQANAYASAQRRKMKGFADFKRIAVVCIPNEEELKRRLADKKEKGYAYTLKDSTLNNLQASFTLPSLEFGWFDDIIFSDLGIDEAKEEVKKYNEKGKKALDESHSHRDKRQRRDNYRNDNRHREDDRRRYDNRNDNRWSDRRAGGGAGGGYYHGGFGGGNRWGGGGGYRNNAGGYRDDRGYGGGGGHGYDQRHHRFSGANQSWVHNNRNRYNDRNDRYSSGGGGGISGRHDSYGGGSRDYRDHRDHRDRDRGGNGGGGSGGGTNNNRRDSHRSSGSSNQRDFRHGHRDTREDSRGGSSATSTTTTSSKYKPSSNNGGYDKYNKNVQPQANNWPQYQVGSVAAQQHQYWNYDTQGYGDQQQWQSMDPQQQQQWMAWWQQQGAAQQADGTVASDPNQYWSQYSYNTSSDATKK